MRLLATFETGTPVQWVTVALVVVLLGLALLARHRLAKP
jgi:hypothetical protein